jgi:hypothetical protein
MWLASGADTKRGQTGGQPGVNMESTGTTLPRRASRAWRPSRTCAPPPLAAGSLRTSTRIEFRAWHTFKLNAHKHHARAEEEEEIHRRSSACPQ